MPTLAEVKQITPKDERDLLHHLKQIRKAVPGCRFSAVSETLGRLGRVAEDQGTTHRPLDGDRATLERFKQMARKPYTQFDSCTRIMYAVAVVDGKGSVRAVLTLSKYCGFTITQSKRPENDIPEREPWQKAKRPGDKGGVGARMPRVKRMNRHFSSEAPMPEGQDLRTTRRT